jgi:lipopolysaccharide biosynthesis glycosyltransferase
MALANSIKNVNPEMKFLVCLVEREVHPAAAGFSNFDDIVLGKDMGFSDFDQFIFKHSIVEASTAVKGKLFQYMLKAYPQENKFIYLDPDIYAYSDFKELNEILDHESVVLAPHLLAPGNIEMEISSLKHGVFNLGFLAISRTENSQLFIDWWAERLNQFCYDDIPGGIFTDQKWVNLAPCFFDVHILKHAGYDYATWSLKTSELVKCGNEYFVGNDPLRFIHFSGFDSGTINWAIQEWIQDKNNPFIALYHEYKQILEACGQNTLGHAPWNYSCFTSGEKIERNVREFYRSMQNEYCGNPFESSNEEIRRNYNHKQKDAGDRKSLVNKGLDILMRDGVAAFKSKFVHYIKRKYL